MESGALVAAAERGALSSLWYLGLNDNHFSDAGLAALATMLVDGALPRLEFVTASSEQSSDEAQLAAVRAAGPLATARREPRTHSGSRSAGVLPNRFGKFVRWR